VPELCQFPMFFVRLGLALSEKQVRQVDVNTEEARGLLETLEPVDMRPRQARYQAALRPNRKCEIHSKALSNLTPSAARLGGLLPITLEFARRVSDILNRKRIESWWKRGLRLWLSSVVICGFGCERYARPRSLTGFIGCREAHFKGGYFRGRCACRPVFREQDAREDQRCTTEFAEAHPFALYEIRSDRCEHGLEAEDDRGVTGRSILLCPHLQRQANHGAAD
jgi:hypothetical protein